MEGRNMDKHTKSGYEESEIADKFETSQVTVGGIKAAKMKAYSCSAALSISLCQVLASCSLNHATYSLGRRNAVGNSG
ncbi:hypothetical protein DITRI_Ditri17bG0110900 [Diplodiscus trichospermus]